MILDEAASRRVISRDIGGPLGLDRARAAWGIHEIINEDVARAFRVHASERGFDYRACSMIAFGGCGPIHALRIARKLKIPRVVFPVGAGVMSAFGLLVSPLSFEIAKSERVVVSDLGPSDLVQKFRPLIEETAGYLRQAGTVESGITITRRLDMRYYGQGYEIEVTLPNTDDPVELLGQIPALFARNYENVFGMSFLSEGIEIVNWKVEASGPLPEMGMEYHLLQMEAGGSARKGARAAYFPEENGYIECPVYNRYALRPGMTLGGPALVEERESTCVIGIGDMVRVDRRYNLVAEISREGTDQ
jgi:N-methylhydantoinase A